MPHKKRNNVTKTKGSPKIFACDSIWFIYGEIFCGCFYQICLKCGSERARDRDAPLFKRKLTAHIHLIQMRLQQCKCLNNVKCVTKIHY